MCGLTGFFSPAHLAENAAEVARRMGDAITHRGPDDAGVWVDEAAGIALSHRRLSILDLSPAGHQPMASPGGRYVIVFNGEIYNHLELREALSGIAWRGHSDTETLLAAFEAWGIEATLKKCVGMFALALWNREMRTLTLARDRLGEKPLYYGWCGDVFLFGSELKALRAHPAWRGRINRNALSDYMRYGYVPLPHSIYQGIAKLPPGSWLTLAADTPVAAPQGYFPGTDSKLRGVSPAPIFYWRARDAAQVGVRHDLNDETAIDELDTLLRRAIGGQMLADVPLGAFLSGGVDSSTVVALMQVQSPRPVRTFTIGFDESGYDEAQHAKAVAAHLGTEHTALYLSAQDALDVIPRLPQMYDEPFGDSSQIPTYLVAAMARQHVTVALSGDGGDELFGGYNRYFWGRSIWRRIGTLPIPLRRMLGGMMTTLSPSTWDRLGGALPSRLRQPTLGDKIHKLASVIDVANPEALYQRLVSQHRESGSIVIGAGASADAPQWADSEVAAFTRQDFTERMMFHDLVGYLPNDILTKVDRAAMAVSLETRVPLLDHHIAEFAWQLPLHMKIRHGQGKWLLRQVLYRYVPKELIERPKQGFGVPIGDWLRGPLRDWAEALLDESRLRREGFLHPAPVREKWEEHLSGRRNWQYWLWNVLMFQAWLEAQTDAGIYSAA